MRFYLALWLAKAAALMLKVASRFTSMKGTNFPGELALKICPDFIARVGKPGTIIAVTGTNGKTTTSNLINSILTECGYDVINNGYGSNINSGVATALLKGVSVFNKPLKEMAVLEVDERSCVRIYPHMKPDYIVVTNLARDTIMRNAHPEYIFDLLDKYIPDTTKMILNADDPITFRLKKDNPRAYYGFDRQPGDSTVDTHLANDVKICPVCHSLIEYDYFKYDHMGRVHCPSCGYASPEADYAVQSVDAEKSLICLRHGGALTELHMTNDSVFNIYNEAAAIALVSELGVPMEKIASALSSVSIVDTRLIENTYGGVTVCAIMSKGNTPALNAVLDYCVGRPGKKEVIMYLEDKHEVTHSAEKITWIWDTDFELLSDPSFTRVAVTGITRFDYGFRLSLAGVDGSKLVLPPEPKDVAAEMNLEPGSTVFVLTDLFNDKERDVMVSMIRARLEEKDGH